ATRRDAPHDVAQVRASWFFGTKPDPRSHAAVFPGGHQSPASNQTPRGGTRDEPCRGANGSRLNRDAERDLECARAGTRRGCPAASRPGATAGRVCNPRGARVVTCISIPTTKPTARARG